MAAGAVTEVAVGQSVGMGVGAAVSTGATVAVGVAVWAASTTVGGASVTGVEAESGSTGSQDDPHGHHAC